MNVVLGRRIVPKQGIDTYIQLLEDGLRTCEGINISEFVDTENKAVFNQKTFAGKFRQLMDLLYRDQIELPRFLLKQEADLFHCTENYGMPFRLPCKAITTIHDIIVLKDKSTSRFAKYRFGKQMQTAIQKSEAIITVSEFSKNDIIEEFSINHDKVHVVYLSMNDAFRVLPIDNIKNDLEQKFQIRGAYILAIGGNHPRKNLNRILNIYEKNYQNKYQLVIVGVAIFEPRVSINELIKKKKIIFTNFIEQDDLVLLYNGASVFLYPSLYEGFGLPILEAMACGTPVVTSNTTSIPEVAGDAAILVNPYDCEDISSGIGRILYDSNESKEYIGRGKERVKFFDKKTMANKTYEIYKESV